MRMHFVQKANRISTYEIDVDMVLSRNSVLKCFLFQNELYLVIDWLTYAQCSTCLFVESHRMFEFNYKEMNISNGFNYIQSSMFDHSKPKLGCSSLITKRWTHLSSFDVWTKIFSNLFNKQFSKSSEGPIRFEFRCSIVRCQK